MSTSQPTCLLSKPLSWHDRRCSTTPTISTQLSPRRRGEANRAGCWYRQRIGPSIPILNGGTPPEPKVTWWKCQAQATPFTSPDPRRLQRSSNKLHHTLVRNGSHNDPAKMSTNIRNRLAGNIEKWFPTKL